MSDYRESAIKAKDKRDDRSVEPDIRNGKKAKPTRKDKPWAFCIQYIFPSSPLGNVWRTYYVTRELAEVQMRKYERESQRVVKKMAWIEYNGERVCSDEIEKDKLAQPDNNRLE